MSALDAMFCGHCGERLPRFGARLRYCVPCAQNYRRVVNEQRAAPASGLHAAPPTTKDPLLASVLSAIVPGGGQIYNGHILKAGLIFVTSPLVLPWLIGIADAFLSARKINERAGATYAGAQT